MKMTIGLGFSLLFLNSRPSWLDQKECIVLDYSKTSLVAQWIRERHSSEATWLTAKKFKRRFPVLAPTR